MSNISLDVIFPSCSLLGYLYKPEGGIRERNGGNDGNAENQGGNAGNQGGNEENLDSGLWALDSGRCYVTKECRKKSLL